MPAVVKASTILKDVNPEQKEAICHLEGPLLVLAGAGSGKTRVVTRRIAYLLEQGARPSEILAITFTNKAAGEMRKRVESLTSLTGLWVSTFHSFGARILRRHISSLGRASEFTIFDTDDKLKLVREVLRQLELDSTNFSPSTLASTISNAKNQLLSVQEYAARHKDYYGQIAAKVYGKYEELLEQNNGLDFDDLLVKLLELLADHDRVLETLQQRFKFVLIDEYQDTNRAQYYIARLLSGDRRNLHVTGDPDQSIYSWRGADINNILDFEKDYEEARVVKLEQNYRSTKRILAGADAVIRNNEKRKPKSLWTDNEEGELIHILHSDDEEDEAKSVAERIQELASGDLELSDVAIFYRTNAQSRVLEQAMIDAKLPYAIVGGLSFFERKEVKDVLAYARAIANPRDNVSLERIINVPTRGIGKGTLQVLKDFAARNSIPLSQAVHAVGQVPGLTKRALTAVERFGHVLNALEAAPKSPAAEFFRKILDVSGYVESLKKSKDPDAVDRIENVMELVSAAESYDSDSPEGDLQGFIEQSVLVQDLDSWDEEQPRVALMTLHSAKGLEFPAVFVVGMEENLLPHANSLDSPDSTEEERRLCYVGMTRAENRLFLSCASERRQFGTYNMNAPSRFLSEIPRDLIREENPEPDGDDYYYDEDGDTDFEIGDYVRHHRFGNGTIDDIEYGRLGITLKIRFQRSGVKRLDASIARLERL